MSKKIFNSLFLSIELILQDLDLGLEFDVVLLDLIIEHLHLERLLIQLFLLFSVEPVTSCLAFNWSIRIGDTSWQTSAHY